MTHLPKLCGHEPFFTSFYLSGPWIEASCRLTTDSFICNSTFYLGISIQIMIEIEEALWLAADDVDKNFKWGDVVSDVEEPSSEEESESSEEEGWFLFFIFYWKFCLFLF